VSLLSAYPHIGQLLTDSFVAGQVLGAGRGLGDLKAQEQQQQQCQHWWSSGGFEPLSGSSGSNVP
jgi:hypothetical protein